MARVKKRVAKGSSKLDRIDIDGQANTFGKGQALMELGEFMAKGSHLPRQKCYLITVEGIRSEQGSG